MGDNPFRLIPAVNDLLQRPDIRALHENHAHQIVVGAIRLELEIVRNSLGNGDQTIDLDALTRRVVERVQTGAEASLRPVINATGIILHTNLGRSPLAEEAATAAYEAARGYLNLELDLTTGKRSSRQNPIREILTRLTGAESATAVNNCAAATVLALRTLAAGKEVVLSRGQLIEIGGSFRIPEIMAVSGAVLREVGTTNITRLSDYENAIGADTALLMRVHSSNFRIRGFTEEVELAELVELGRKHTLPVIDDVGSGALLDFAPFGLTDEPVVQQSIAAGADLVLCSGDKLLGGPQAGLILGKKKLIERIEKDPLMRAFRLDKMTLAALEATLRLYLRPGQGLSAIPTLRMLSMKPDFVRQRAQALTSRLQSRSVAAHVEVLDDEAYVGGGSFPDQPLSATVVAVKPEKMTESQLVERLRLGRPAVLARVQAGAVLFDLRTVLEWQEDELVEAIAHALGRE